MSRALLLPAILVCLSVALAAVPLGFSLAQPAPEDPVKTAASAAVGYADGSCLSLSEGRRALQAGKSISLANAVKIAHEGTPGEIVDYKICKTDSGYSYVLTLLRRDGKIARAWVDALSGKLLSVK